MNQTIEPARFLDFRPVLKPETKIRLIFLAVCFGLVFLIYGRTIAGDFVFDDRGIVEHQALLADVNKLDRVLTLPYWAETAGLYRPITLLSYTFNFLLLGSPPAGFHLVNLILYALTGFLIYLLIEKLSGRRLPAYLAALLFLLLPIHSEAVANITGRSEILVLLFSLFMLLALLKKPAEPRGWRSLKNYWPAGLWFFLALGSKETAVAALPVAAVMIYAREKNFWRREVFFKHLPAGLWLAAAAFFYFGLRLLALGRQYFLAAETSLVENPLQFVPAGPRIFTALSVIALYVKKSLWPLDLCSDYSYNQIPVIYDFFNPGALTGLVILLATAAGIFFFARRAPLLSLAAAFFLFGFLPAANLIFPTGTIMGERLAYFPSLGLALLLAFGLYRLYNFRLAAARYSAVIIFAGLTIFYAVIGFSRAGDWLTEKRLFSSAAACAPGSVLSLSNLGAVYYLEGDLAAAKKELLAAQKIYDGYPKGINNLGLVYWKEGNNAKARQLFLKALDFKFPYYGAYENLALVSLEEGKIDEARGWLLKLYSGDGLAADYYIESRLRP